MFDPLVSSALFVRSDPFVALLGCGHAFFKASDKREFLFIPLVASLSEPRPPSQPLKGLRQGRPSARPMVAVVFYSGASRCSPRFVLEPPCGEGERIALALHAWRRRASPSPTRRLYFPAHPPPERKRRSWFFRGLVDV